MKRYNINYANKYFLDAQKFNSLTAKRFGFDESIDYRLSDLSEDFRERNKNILSQERGGGYWIWKSHLIQKTLKEINYGDLVAYSDAGSIYCSSIQPLVDIISKDVKGVLSFEVRGFTEKMHTKRDLLQYMNMDEDKYLNQFQVCGGYIWLIKNELTIKLIDEFCEICKNYHFLDDSTSKIEEYSEFKEHRHDQSIWSLLCKKYEIEPHKFITDDFDDDNNYPNDKYPAISRSMRQWKNGVDWIFHSMVMQLLK